MFCHFDVYGVIPSTVNLKKAGRRGGSSVSTCIDIAIAPDTTRKGDITYA